MSQPPSTSEPYAIQIANEDGVYQTVRLSRRFHQEQNRELWEWSAAEEPTIFDSESEALTIVQAIRDERGGGWGVRSVPASKAHTP